MLNKVCYLGDDDWTRAAAYLSGVMLYYNIDFDRIDSTDSPPTDFCDKTYSLYIISDYPSNRFLPGQMEHIADSVTNRGSGLLMIGGWESYHGLAGEYNQSPLTEILPVIMQSSDDRKCAASGIFVVPANADSAPKHPILNSLPWNTPPSAVGYNEVIPKTDSQTLLEGVLCDVRLFWGEELAFEPMKWVPILVVRAGTDFAGRVAAFTSDVAPHWVGGLVDWGQQRIKQDVGEGFIEVGESYAQFFRNLVLWTAGRL